MREDVVIERSTRMSRLTGLAAIVGVLVLAAGPMLWNDGVLRMMLEFFYLLALAQMWNLLAGYAGLVSIGQQAYIGITISIFAVKVLQRDAPAYFVACKHRDSDK